MDVARRGFCHLLVLLIAFVGWSAAQLEAASVLYESAAQGSTATPGGQSLSTKQLIGWRFHVDQTILVTEVGGHLLGTGGELFAAIVELSALDAFPTGAPFSASEVAGHTLFAPPLPSDNILTPLTAALAPGNYALVFGSGQFDVTGTGAVPNQPDQTHVDPTTADSFIFWNQITPGVYGWRAGLNSMMRFAVAGQELVGTADFNLDGVIDTADVAVWADNNPLASGATILTGDADGDGDNDGSDFLAWQQQFGQGVAGSVSTVPEPAGAAVGCCALVLLLGGRWRPENLWFVNLTFWGASCQKSF